MEQNVIACLEVIPQLQILRYVILFLAHKSSLQNTLYPLLRYANCAARFIDSYAQGLSGPEAAWANKKYHGHHTLPPDMAASLKKLYGEHMAKLGAQL
jgi:hypothetical protein